MAAAGALGPIIPPSLIMVFMGVVNNVSIGGLFIAGVIPGLLVGLSLMVAAYLHALKGGPAYLEIEPFSLSKLWATLVAALPALVMPLIIIGGILGGVFTATEAAVVAVAYGCLVGLLVYRDLRLSAVPAILVASALQSAVVMLIIGTANLFAWLVAAEQVPGTVAATIKSMSSSPVIFLLLVNLLFFVIGMFLESIAAIIIFMPLLFPVATSFGIDPLHFSVVAAVNLSIGLATPPYGATLFAASMLSRRSIRQVTPFIIPMVVAMVVVLLLITYIPEIVLFLPRLLMGYRPVGG
jgi:C4-dicarboxylate transporter DctM subunit